MKCYIEFTDGGEQWILVEVVEREADWFRVVVNLVEDFYYYYKDEQIKILKIDGEQIYPKAENTKRTHSFAVMETQGEDIELLKAENRALKAENERTK